MRAYTQYGLEAKPAGCRMSHPEKVNKLRYRASQTFTRLHRASTGRALNIRYGASRAQSDPVGHLWAKRRSRTALMSLSPTLARQGPSQTARAGVIDGKIATIFHGIDISSREVLEPLHAGVSAAVPARRHDAAHQRPLGRTPQKDGLPGEKITVSRMGVDLARFTRRRSRCRVNRCRLSPLPD